MTKRSEHENNSIVRKLIFQKEKPVAKDCFTLISGIVVSGNLKPEPVNLETFMSNSGPQFDTSGYTICTEFINSCHDLSYLPKTKTFVLTTDSFCKLVEENELFVENVSKALGIEKHQAMNEISTYFEDKRLLVQQTGVQG